MRTTTRQIPARLRVFAALLTEFSRDYGGGDEATEMAAASKGALSKYRYGDRAPSVEATEKLIKFWKLPENKAEQFRTEAARAKAGRHQAANLHVSTLEKNLAKASRQLEENAAQIADLTDLARTIATNLVNSSDPALVALGTQVLRRLRHA